MYDRIDYVSLSGLYVFKIEVLACALFFLVGRDRK